LRYANVSTIDLTRRGNELCSPQRSIGISKNNNWGFTVVELLAVTVVIGFIVSLTVPALSWAKRAAEAAVCRSNQRQCTLAIATYIDDNEVFPMGYQYFPTLISPYLGSSSGSVYSAAPGGIMWASTLESSVVHCPSFSRLPNAYGAAYGYNWGGVSGDTPLSDANRRYQLGLRGEVLSSSLQVPKQVRAIRESQVLNPAGMISFGDALTVTLETDKGAVAQTSAIADLSQIIRRRDFLVPNNLFFRYWRKRHDDRSNISFSDGHLETLEHARFINSKTPECRQLWNNDSQPHPEF
jgi:prepilin-type processing-associated H-X9-DG protein